MRYFIEDEAQDEEDEEEVDPKYTNDDDGQSLLALLSEINGKDLLYKFDPHFMLQREGEAWESRESRRRRMAN